MRFAVRIRSMAMPNTILNFRGNLLPPMAKPSQPPILSNARRILVRAPNWVGDVMMSTPALARLRRLNREARIVALARPGMASLLEGNPNLDEVWAIDDRSPMGCLAALGRIRAGRFDAGLLFPNSFKSALLLRMAGVKRLRGFARDGRRSLLAEPVEFEPDFYSVHEVLNYLRLVDDAFSDPFSGATRSLSETRPGFPPLELYLGDADRAELNSRLAELDISPEGPFLSITPGAAYGTAKRWHPDRFASVAARLASEAGWTVLVMGSDAESEAAEEVCQGIRDTASGAVPAFNLAGRWSLRLLAGVLERTRLHLTNDSGPMHMAAALGTPLVAIYGPTDWITTAPWSARARIVRTFTECSPCLLRHCPIDHRCMERVAVDQALAAAREVLRIEPAPRPAK